MDDGKPTSSSITHEEAASYLRNLLNRTLRIHIQDGRVFVGTMKCTDRERNVVLAGTHEYRRHPQARSAPAASSAIPSVADLASTKSPGVLEDSHSGQASDTNIRKYATAARSPPMTKNGLQGMIKRFVGLVVVPGHVITKVEVD